MKMGEKEKEVETRDAGVYEQCSGKNDNAHFYMRFICAPWLLRVYLEFYTSIHRT